ncbi:MAG: DUF1799 domain-containing protein [Xanthomonadales bacterium]|nr:DUF1799 domain-containing protein [Xanthomonadales bacterium]
MKAHGAPQRDINRNRRLWFAQQPEVDPRFEIYPENCVAFQVFWSLRNEWEQPSDHGGRYTIPRPDIESTMRMMGVADIADTFWRVCKLIDTARPIKLHQLIEERRNAAARRA